MAGDAETGVQIMQMSEGLDEGPVLLSERLGISPRDTAATLSERMAHIGAGLWPRALAALERGGGQPVEQVGEPTYAVKITPPRPASTGPARRPKWMRISGACRPFPGPRSRW